MIPATTPTEVQTSVRRWWASARSVIERKRRPAAKSVTATAPFTADATTDTAIPTHGSTMGAGFCHRSQAAIAIPRAAARMRKPSAPLAKYSALEYPKSCVGSGGFVATVRAQRAISAATRLTTDSAASERSPTDPVSLQAAAFRAIVTTAAAIEITA